MKKPTLLLVQTGSVAEPAVKAAHGDYPAWFERAFAGAAELRVLRAHEGEKIRDGLDGIVVTGSPLSVTERAPWMDELGQALFEQGRRGTPVLGVCFGHQLLCRAAGGEVVKNPRGREIGTVEVELTEAGRRDPLFAWAAAPRVAVQATHLDAVDPLPRSATVLAGNENTPAQAVRFSEAVAAVQFHPELDPATLRALVEARREKLRAEGIDVPSVRETESRRILLAFADQCRK